MSGELLLSRKVESIIKLLLSLSLSFKRCSHDADCVESRCQCRAGFEGDGYVCNHICGHDQVLENGRCVPILLDEHSVQPQCNFLGECECPTGYELIEDSQTCRYTAQYTSDSKSEELSE